MVCTSATQHQAAAIQVDIGMALPEPLLNALFSFHATEPLMGDTMKGD